MREIALTHKPDTVTLVPEKRQELTTEGGLDAVGLKSQLAEYLKPFGDNNIEVSLFIDPEISQIEAAVEVGAQIVELSTAKYVEAESAAQREEEYRRLVEAARYAAESGLQVAAGHGLDYYNTEPIAKIPQIVELNIGHSIVSRAVLVGLERAVKEMLEIIRRARQ